MVTLVDYDMAVLRHQILDLTFSIQALDDGHVNDAWSSSLSAADLADRINRQIQKRRKTLSPLVQKLRAVDQHKGVRPSSGDQESGGDGFPERSASAKDAFIVFQKLRHCVRLLFLAGCR